MHRPSGCRPRLDLGQVSQQFNIVADSRGGASQLHARLDRVLLDQQVRHTPERLSGGGRHFGLETQQLREDFVIRADGPEIVNQLESGLEASGGRFWPLAVNCALVKTLAPPPCRPAPRESVRAPRLSGPFVRSSWSRWTK